MGCLVFRKLRRLTTSLIISGCLWSLLLVTGHRAPFFIVVITHGGSEGCSIRREYKFCSRNICLACGPAHKIAAVLGQDESKVFKTLVTVGKSGDHYVFVVPVNKELNLRKAAKAVNEKSIEMIKSKELLPLTGYIHGGCSPIGMKKRFATVVDESAAGQDTILVNAGKIGYQIEIKPDDLKKIIPFFYADISE
jgi:Cys-tRNA(Pro)/Cys-tRNA(Cys) deacylase